MDLLYRPAKESDFEKCVVFLRESFALAPEVNRKVPEIWRQLTRQRQMIFVVVEDAARPAGEQIVGFGASVFVTEDFFRELQEVPVPYSSARVLNRILEGDSPVLTPAKVAEGNAGGGLYLLVLHHSWAHRMLSPDEVPLVRNQIVKSFLECHSGYNLKAILSEAIGEAEIEWIVKGNAFRLRETYDAFYRSQPLPPPELRSCLIGITREEAMAADSTLTPLFLHVEPRFCFRPGEQQLLELALRGKTDAEIASEANISHSAVKKRWTSIYDRVSMKAPELLPDAGTGASLTRGPEKRHLLLNYLRRHLEELRPHAARGGARSLGA